jgi:hypothetical protein
MSRWNNVNLNGPYWTKFPNKRFSIASICFSANISKFYNLLNPEIVLTIEAGKYEVKI